MMKYFVSIFLIAGLLYACSTPEAVTEEEPVEETEEVEERTAPDWYDGTETSTQDSLHFTGYASAVAADSIEAEEQSTEVAVQNLKFAIDKFAEEGREELAESGSAQYGETDFIIDLRNAVYRLDLSGAETTVEKFRNDNDAHVAFTKLQISIEDALRQLSTELGDDDFVDSLRL